MAVAFFNRGKDASAIKVTSADLKIPGKWKARDLWTKENVTWPETEYSVTVPGHGVVMLRLSK